MTREEAIESLKGLLESNYVDSFEDAENEALEMAIKALEQEPKTGHWIDDNGIYAWCSCCKEHIYQTGEFKYCPNCGARMERSDTE